MIKSLNELSIFGMIGMVKLIARGLVSGRIKMSGIITMQVFIISTISRGRGFGS